MEGPAGGGEPIRAEGLHTDEGEHHDRRFPMLKKVKDKVKKIKDTIKKKHDHENDHGSGSNATDDDDDVEEEQDPEIHGAPIYESEAIHDVGLVHAIEDLEEDPGAPNRRTSIPGSGPEPGFIRSFQAISVSSDQPKKDEDEKKSSPLPTSVDMGEDPGAPMSQTATSTYSPGSYQTNVTGGPEPGVIRSSTEDKLEEEEKVDPHHKDQSYKEKILATAIKDTVVSATTGGSSSTSSNEEDVGKGKQKQQDNGVSLREYLAEKLSPGEEDKALSEVISGFATATKKKKESDAATVLAEDEKKEVEHQGVMGTATKKKKESDAATVLAEDEKKKEVEHQGVMGKIKGAVTSLLGGGGEPKKLQESSN